MRINSSGGVNIGATSSASVKLTVYGSQCRFQGASTGVGEVDGFGVGNNGAVDAFVWNYENGKLMFATNNTERMRIENTGRSEVFSSDGNVFGVGTSTGAGVTDYALYVVYGRTGVLSGGAVSFGVFTNGNTVNANNSYGAISDIKLKENIVDASSQWDDIKDLRVRNYNFIEGQTHTQIGVVAQEVETVSPGLVFESPDFDDEGNDLGTTTKSVNYSVLYMKAVKALQEAMDRIETLEAKVAALEAG